MDVISGGGSDRLPRRGRRGLALIVVAAAVISGTAYLAAHRDVAVPRQPSATVAPSPAAPDAVVLEGRVAPAAGWQYVGYSPADPTSLRRGYVRFDGNGASLLGTADGVVDVLVAPHATALLFRDRVQVFRQAGNVVSMLGPADAVLPTYDRRGVLLVAGRDPAVGQKVRRVDLDGHETAPVVTVPAGVRPLAEVTGRRLVVRQRAGALVVWDPRSMTSQPLGSNGFLDSVVGGWAVTHESCGADACRYRLCPLGGTRPIAVALPRRTQLLSPPVPSPDGQHFAVVANVFTRYDAPAVALGVATIRSGGADVRFIAGVAYADGQPSRGGRPSWSRDGRIVYVPRPLTGEVVAFRLGTAWPEITPFHLADASRVWL